MMPRQKSLSSYDKEIKVLKSHLTKTKLRYEALEDKMIALQEKRNEQEAKQIMAAYRRSNRSLQELMIFLEA
jgi:septal ring factor EnvC (AmiA/AmiB activator)